MSEISLLSLPWKSGVDPIGRNNKGWLLQQLEPHFATSGFGGSFHLEGRSARHLHYAGGRVYQVSRLLSRYLLLLVMFEALV